MNITGTTLTGCILGPYTADPYFPYVTLLLHLNGANNSTTFTDSSSNGWLASSIGGNAKISTVQYVFGGASGLFDGTGDYIGYNQPVVMLSNSDFTFETRFRANSFSDLHTLLSKWSATLNGLRNFIWYATQNNMQFWWTTDGVTNQSQIFTFPTPLVTDQWYSLALCRNGSSLYAFLDGQLFQTGTLSGTVNTTLGSMFLGSLYGSTRFVNGYIDEFRITVGVCRYLSNYSVSTQEFPNS